MNGTRLRSLRLGRSLKQEELGRILGVGKTTISQYESESRKPDSEMLLKIAELFDVSVDYLLGATDAPSPSVKSSNNGGRAFLGGADSYTDEELEVANAAAQAAIEALRKARANKKH